ncbi:unnamed protein product [Paramecium pentaurelia]|uniref:Uncharacterized protein n=1 Tax=Paramecium pentaurelia TaxID=43138 RepID=A0A8S1X1L4_9CILI|nr:unnamed protein product [Paramecium pentaurelia]
MKYFRVCDFKIQVSILIRKGVIQIKKKNIINIFSFLCFFLEQNRNIKFKIKVQINLLFNQIFAPKMIENEKDICCSKGHQLHVVTVVLDPKLIKNQRLLCTECLETTEIEAKVVGLKIITQYIKDGQVKKMERIENIIINQVKQIEQLLGAVNQLKSVVIQQLDQFITIIKDWIQNLLSQGSQYAKFSFFEELDMIILKQNKIEINFEKIINEIHKTNYSWNSKLHPKLEYFNKFVEYNKCKELLSNMDLNSQKFSQSEQQNQIKVNPQQQPNQNQQQVLQLVEIKLKLIDQSIKQIIKCNAIVFDSSGSIMVSTEKNDIKVWSFLNGTIKLIKVLQGHSNWIQCLVYSKKQNSFISGSGDMSIRCWQQLDQTNWNSSLPYIYHRDFVRCILLNSNEDLLFSGGDDKQIIVWKADLNENKLKCLYSLDKHNNSVVALSLNQSEKYLVSCARDKNQIIIWERKNENKFEFKYFVNQSIQSCGFKVKFIKENQFIWITGNKDIDQLYVFELKDGVFQENQEKAIKLIQNQMTVDEYHFPITYNKEKNLIVF